MPANLRYIRWFSEIGIDDVPLVGGKNASLGEMYRELSAQGVKVPNGFAVTAEGYRYFLRSAGLDRRIPEMLAGLDTRRRRESARARPASPRCDPRGRAAGRPGRRNRRGLRRAGRKRESICWTWPFAAVRRPRTCPTPALPASRRPI